MRHIHSNIARLFPGLLLSSFLLSGCGGYIIAPFIPPSDWQGDKIDISRISEIVVGKTTREEIDTIFGMPEDVSKREGMHAALGIPKDDTEPASENYYYSILRTKVVGDILAGVAIKPEVKTVLMVLFDDEGIVTSFTGPDPGVEEILQEMP